MTVPPPPNGQVLSLVSALSNPENHALHLEAIRARDEALSSSAETYGNLCLQLSYVLAGSDNPVELIRRIDPRDMEAWRQTDMTMALRMQQDLASWIPFGQMAGLILKNALLRPPILSDGRSLFLHSRVADHVRETLLYSLGCQHAELRAVASSVIATTALSCDSVQPSLFVRAWPTLVPTLIHNLQQQTNPALVEGSLSTIRKMMEDNASDLSQEELDALVPVLVRFLTSDQESYKVLALQSLIFCLTDDMMPSALALCTKDYLAALSHLATDPSPQVRKWVCRSIVTLMDLRTEHIQEHMSAICQFMLQCTADINHDSVALEACEFWLTFASLEDGVCTEEMFDCVVNLLPQLIPVLLRNMVYSTDKQDELRARNEIDGQENNVAQAMRPIFHSSRAKQAGVGAGTIEDDGSVSGGGDDDDDDDDEFDDDEGNEWTLRKCAAASLDSLANIFGAEFVLPPVLSALQGGLTNPDPWVQEASILALGAIAEGCYEEMNAHLDQLFPYLMNHLAAPESPENLPQVKCIAAWTIGRYASWAIEQVRTGARGHLLAQLTEIFVTRLRDRNRRVQVACCSAFAVVIEAAGDLMTPYLEPVYQGLVSALSRYQGRSLLLIFDVFGVMGDSCGPAISKGNLPAIYIPSLLQILSDVARNDPGDRTLLPLMESLSSIAMTSGMNYQPYALESFESAMGIIEAVTLVLTTSSDKIENEEDADPIVCALDLLDGLVEGLGTNFAALVSSSQQFAPHFLSVLLATCKHDIAAVRMSALALLGDIAHNAPVMLEPALPQLLHEAISNMDPIQPSVSLNAVWAIGEICVQCEGNAALLEPFVPSLMQNLISLLNGNGVGGEGRGIDIAGLPENAAACVGRLAKVDPNFVAPDLSRFLLGWCDGMAKIADLTERRDAFQGFVRVVYATPESILQAAANVTDAITSILFAIVTWHIPPGLSDQSTILHGDYRFLPFPQTEAELGEALVRLVSDMKSSVGEDTWHRVQKNLPVNARRLLREAYKV